ncbi:Digalactosyldiacylglycerol synthase 1, partial [Sesbania bispinosa]
NAIVSEEVDEGIVDFERGKRGRSLSFWEELKGEGEVEARDWEPIRALKTRLKEFEKRSSSVEIFDGFKNSEFLEKLKSSL